MPTSRSPSVEIASHAQVHSAPRATSSTTTPAKRKASGNTGHTASIQPNSKRAKATPKKNPEPEESRWPWINRVRPEMQFKGTKVECYNCGGMYFKATGKTVELRLDKVEKFFEECKGDETAHPLYGMC